jgi:hypothetical protein
LAQGTSVGAPEFDMDGEPRGSSVDIGIDQFVDTNDSGMADVWEIEHFGGIGVQPPQGDPDEDGLTNLEEYEQSTDPNNSDTSGNGFPDGWLVQYGYDPTDPDAIDPDGDDDGDGLTNWEEFLYGSDPTNTNTSGNAYSDYEQFNMGYPPGDPMDGSGSSWFIVVGDLGAGVVKTNSRPYTILEGETWAFDVYLQSDEYEDFTGGQSQFNDVLTWSLAPAMGQPATASIDVNSRHQHWVTAEQQGRSLLDFSPIHLEDTILFTAPADTVCW